MRKTSEDMRRMIRKVFQGAPGINVRVHVYHAAVRESTFNVSQVPPAGMVVMQA